MKPCSKCEIRKKSSSFRIRTWTSRHRTVCRSCESKYLSLYRLTPNGRASRMWLGMTWRAGNRDGRSPTYSSVRVMMTRDRFMSWAVPRIRRWLRTRGKREMPTVDRIDGRGDYKIENIQLATQAENTHTRTSNKNVHAPLGKAWCFICTKYLPVGSFHRDRTRPNGRQRKCKACNYSRYQKRGS